MGVFVIGQATGQHGWSALESYANGAQALGHPPRLIRPRAAWDAASLDDDDGLLNLLRRGGDEPMLLCGFDWHSQPIHRDPVMRAALSQHRGPRIGLFQEQLGAAWIRCDAALSRMFDEAALSAASLLTHVVCNHEGDVELLRRLGVRQPIVFLPFSADLAMFRRMQPFAERDPRAYFRGKQLQFMGSSPYADRERIAACLRGRAEALVEDLDPTEQQDRLAMVARYVDDLNRHALQLNLPSVSDSLTCRPFEVMACGGLLLQPVPEGELSQKLLPPHLYVAYDRRRPDQLLAAIAHHQSHVKESEAIATAGHAHVIRWHSAAQRVKQILEWAAGGISDADLYRDLVAASPGPWGMPASHDNHATANSLPAQGSALRPLVLVDLVFYQYQRSGIAQVWNRLLAAWAEMGLSQHLVLARRVGSRHAPPDEVLRHYHCVMLPAHGQPDDADRLQTACDEAGATLFISTYYTLPRRTPSLLMVHDCIPERMNPDCAADPSWADKRAAITYATGYLCVSNISARDLQAFHPGLVTGKPVYVAPNAFASHFAPASDDALQGFLHRHGLQRGYLLFVGERFGYRSYKNVEPICHALAHLARLRPDLPGRLPLLFLGGAELGDDLTIEHELDRHLAAWQIRRLSMEDAEMAAAYTGAALTVYPSLCEGFGLPPGESLMCGTPALGWQSDINQEVYGDLLSCLRPDNPAGLARQLRDVIDALPVLRETARGARAQLLARDMAQGGATQVGTFIECLLLHAQRPLDVCDPAFEPVLFDGLPAERRDWLERLIAGHPDEVTGADLGFGQETLRSAAIVSIYNGAGFVRGCLQDLLAQTEFPAGRMEILLIDSASPGNERDLILDEVRRHPRVRYLRSCERESLYRAWNRGARCASARYLSSANLDDRHRADFFERLSDMLDGEPEVQLAYPAQYLTAIPNEPFADHQPARSWGWPAYTLAQLRSGNHVGSQPMWRRAVHRAVGWFDERYRIAGDYEFWCRIAHRLGPLKLYPVHIGLYYFNGGGIEHGDPLRSEREVAEICQRYGIEKNYTASDADRTRATDEHGGARLRRLEDLQYSGIALKGQINLIVLTGRGVDHALQLAEAGLGQSVSTGYRMPVLLLDPGWSERDLATLNNERLPALSAQVRAARHLSDAPLIDPEACTVLLSDAPTDRFCLEEALRSLHSRQQVRAVSLKQADGSTVGVVGRRLADVWPEGTA